MASITPSSRYSKYTPMSNTSSFDSTKSDPSSSTEYFQRASSRAVVKSKKSTSVATTKANPSNFSSMVKKFVDVKGNSSSKDASNSKLFVPVDFIAEDLKKNGVKKNAGLSGLHKKLFKGLNGKKEGGGSSERKALTEVKSTNANARTLSMVLRSERELLSMNKEQEAQIAELNLLLEEKNREVEKLKDLCLKQREEIKSLKNSILFPDDMNSHLQVLLEKQGSELKQAKELIPNLQMQVTSLTGQLQCLAEDLAEVKADKYSGKGCYDSDFGSPVTPPYYQEEAANYSLEFSSEDHTIPGSPDDMFLKDLNPCLTPYSIKKKSEEFEESAYRVNERLPRYNRQSRHEIDFSSSSRVVSKSSDCCQCSEATKSSVRFARRSDESKCLYRKQTQHKLF